MDFQAIKSKIDAICRKRGLKEYRLVHVYGSSQSAQATGRAISETQSEVSSVMTFTAVVNERGGSSTTNMYDDESLERLVDDAIDNASCLEGSSKCIIFEGSEKYGKLDNEDFKAPAMHDMISKTLEIQNAMQDSDPMVQDGSETSITSRSSRICLANSKGLMMERTFGYNSFFAYAVVKDGDEVKVGYDYGIGELGSMGFGKAVSEAKSKLHGQATQSRRCKAVLSSECVQQMLSAFFPIFTGRSATLGTSLLKGKEGQAVASEKVTLTDDPFEPSSPVKMNFDADGVAAYRKNIIEKGVLKTLLYNLSSAQEAGKETTGNSGPFLEDAETQCFSLYIQPGDKTDEELFAMAGEGIFVQEMKGLHAGCDASTGDFSIESAGFEICGGKKGGPIRSFTVSGSFYQMLKDIEAVSSKLEFSNPSGMSRIGAPMLLVREISVAG